MITIIDKRNCCACAACANICPKGCISMKADEEGFLYPSIDKTSCVNCGLCQKVCPILNKPNTFGVLKTYGAKHKKSEVKLKSSSGGIFTALAQEILQEKGVVFGAAFNENWQVVHTFCEDLKDLDKLRRSKYVQSDIAFTYRQTKDFLDKGRKVLFSGTPCQIAALRNYLGKDYENLLTADIICHAVPSPKVWQKFLRENFDISQIKAINFREKDISWNHFYLSFLTSKGLLAHGKNKTFVERLPFKSLFANITFRNIFLRAFLRELINRPSCHNCHFKGLNGRLADFTMGDLWGKWPHLITKEDKKFGVSALLVNTAKGQTYFNKIAPFISYKEIDIKNVCLSNKALITSTKPHPKRAEFFARYKTENFNKLVRELLNIRPFYIAIFQKIYNKIKGKI